MSSQEIVECLQILYEYPDKELYKITILMRKLLKQASSQVFKLNESEMLSFLEFFSNKVDLPIKIISDILAKIEISFNRNPNAFSTNFTFKLLFHLSYINSESLVAISNQFKQGLFQQIEAKLDVGILRDPQFTNFVIEIVNLDKNIPFKLISRILELTKQLERPESFTYATIRALEIWNPNFNSEKILLPNAVKLI